MRERIPRMLLLATVVACGLTALWPAHAGAREELPFYEDVAAHWARTYIEVLWDEEVLDGFRLRAYSPWRGWYWQSRFFPNRRILRDAWTVMAAKVFRLQPRASGPRHRLDGGQEVAAWLRAATAADWVRGRPAWKGRVSRQETVAMLVRALDLGPYAEGLSWSEALRLLNRYRDHRRVVPRYRKALAAATRLGIVEGYPDRTLRPERELSRAEAVTLLYRSALARVDARPNPFYPDGDGLDDTTTFTLTALRNRNASRWRVVVQSGAGTPLWLTGSAWRRPPRPPARLTWDGRTRGGVSLPPGEYFYRFTLWDRQGQRFDSVLKPLWLDWRRLDGGLSPAVVSPGERISVWAVTRGDARRVTASGPFAPGRVALDARGGSRRHRKWRATYPVPADAAPGPYDLTLTARFPGTRRTRSLPFLVRDPVRLTARLFPNPVQAGGALTVEAEATPNITAVTATFDDGYRLALESLGAGDWRATRVLPFAYAKGAHTVTVVGSGRRGTRRVGLDFRVRGDVREQLRTILTD